MDRNQLKEKRRQIVCREQRNQALLERLLPFLYESDVLGLYCPIDAEADVWNSLRRRSNIVLCRVMPKRQMKFFPAEHLSRSAWGLLEPEVTEEVIPDILITPMLGFDVKEDGIFRIGYGGGYYDRYFASHQKCLRVGIAYQGQQTTLSVQPWDEGLDVLVTEKQVYFSPVLREEIAPEWKKRLERYREEQS